MPGKSKKCLICLEGVVTSYIYQLYTNYLSILFGGIVYNLAIKRILLCKWEYLIT